MQMISISAHLDDASNVIRIWNQWVTEGHTERHAGSQHPPMTNSRENRNTVKLALQNSITT